MPDKTRHEVNYPVGSRVICRSNQDEPLMFGEITEWKQKNNISSPIPLIRDEKDGEIYYVMGVIRHYNEDLLSALEKLAYAEQWNVLAEFGYKR